MLARRRRRASVALASLLPLRRAGRLSGSATASASTNVQSTKRKDARNSRRTRKESAPKSGTAPRCAREGERHDDARPPQSRWHPHGVVANKFQFRRTWLRLDAASVEAGGDRDLGARIPPTGVWTVGRPQRRTGCTDHTR